MNKIRKFFTAYEHAVNSFDADLLSTQFVESYMGADPNGVSCHRNDRSLHEAIAQRRDMYEQMGFRFAEILSIAETPIDDYYTMAKVHWRLVFEKIKGQPREFKFFITYFLFEAPEGLRIVFFIAREDEQKVLRDAGLLPAQPEPVNLRHVILH